MQRSERLIQDTDFDKVPTGLALYLNSDEIKEDIEYVRKNDIPRVGINQHYGYREDDLACLDSLRNLKGIDIESPLNDISTLYKFKNLKRLSISSEFGYVLDLSKFPNLEFLNIIYNQARVKGIESLSKLKFLNLYSYSENNLILLEKIKELQYLHLIEAKIKSLKGVENLTCLKVLDLNYCNNLSDISSASTSLENFFIYSAPKLQDFSIPNNLTNLVYLSFLKTGTINSLDSLKGLSRLDIVEIDANVLDGNLSPLLGVRDVSFKDFPHFSHTNKEINTFLE